VTGSPSVTAWPGGQVAVFAGLAGGDVGCAIQQDAGAGAWAGWTSLGSTVIGVPAAWVSSFGTPAAAVLNGSRRVAIADYDGGSWTRWLALGTGF
jgi:hypothetical protein